MEKKSNHFSSQLGFVLVVAGSAVGVGNLWRFPYLAAKDGGGLFLLIYLVPVLIMTYYAVIGGWITKYAVVYLTGQAQTAAQDAYFTSFISSLVAPAAFTLLFTGVTALIVFRGVQGGIERVSRLMMPVLLVLVVVIAGYSLTLEHTDEVGNLRTGLQGLGYYLTPHLEGLSVQRFLQILLDAMSQLCFSLSVSMGIMITYGSYVKKDVNLDKAVKQIEKHMHLAALF